MRSDWLPARWQCMRKTDAAAQAAPLAIRTAGGKAVPVGKFKRRVQDPFEIAAVVNIAAACLVRHGNWANEIAPPDRDRINVHFARRLVEEALHDKGGFRLSRTAVGARRAGVGKHAARDRVDVRNVVGARIADRGVERRHAGRIAEIGAEIDIDRGSERQDTTRGIECHRRHRDLMPSVGIGGDALGTLAGPFDRAL